MSVFVVEESDVTRVYKNASNVIIRVDTIFMEPTTNQLTSGVNAKTFYRRLSTQVHHGTDRTVASIEIYTDADTIETVSGNYTFVEWTGGNAGTTYRCNMSDLPIVGGTV